MKRSILFITLFTATAFSNAQTQIGNGDFEQWETTTPELAEPLNWNSFKTASGLWNSFGGQQLNKSTEVRPNSTGLYSAKIESNDVGLAIANGNLTLGRIEMGSTSPANAANYNYSSTGDPKYSEAFTDTPDSIYFWAKFTPNASNTNVSARISAVIHNNTNNYKDPNDVSGANTVAKAILNFPYSGGNWELIKVPFVYVGNPADAAFIIVTFTTNMTPGGGSDADILLIDDIELIYDQTGVNELNNSLIHVYVNGEVLEVASKSELEGEYSIFNSNGSLVQSGKITHEIDFNNTPGMYFLHLNTPQGTVVKKFIKN